MRKVSSGLCCPFIHSVVSNDSVIGVQRPWSDCTNAQADLGLRCPYMPEDMFSHSAANTSYGTKLCRQITGIPMGTNCAPVVADLFLFTRATSCGLSLVKGKPMFKLHLIQRVDNKWVDDIPLSMVLLAWSLALPVSAWGVCTMFHPYNFHSTRKWWKRFSCVYWMH